jgi:hypothetical protein
MNDVCAVGGCVNDCQVANLINNRNRQKQLIVRFGSLDVWTRIDSSPNL